MLFGIVVLVQATAVFDSYHLQGKFVKDILDGTIYSPIRFGYIFICLDSDHPTDGIGFSEKVHHVRQYCKQFGRNKIPSMRLVYEVSVTICNKSEFNNAVPVTDVSKLCDFDFEKNFDSVVQLC